MPTRDSGLPRLSRVITVVLLDWAALGATVWLAPGISADNWWSVLLAAVVLGLLAAALRPLLSVLLTWLGWIGVAAGWLLTQALLVFVTLSITPGLRFDGFWTAFWASWLYAFLVSIGLWFVTAGDQTIVVRHLLRVNRSHRRATRETAVPGVIMIQIDGLSAPLARWAVRCGNLPTLGRWLRSGSHVLVDWHAQLPATTPASQAGLLHGASEHVPAFRWYEKDNGALVVTNHPRDSALVESRMTNGRGLLADGGVSVSNVFSGDAPTSLLTMSTATNARGAGRRANYVTAYLLDPFGLTRSLVLTIGEIVKELHQARRQRLRNVEPRIHRSWSYVLLRGATNVLLRHLNVSIIAEHMMRGTPSVYCDFVDYDEIAHHAGPARPEALASLEGIDGVLATLEGLAADAPRPYHFVVLSDHGQSQGATFRQRYGIGLDDLVQQFTAVDDAGVVATDADEQEGRVRTLRAGLVPGRTDGEKKPVRARIIVVASGNLGMVYLADRPRRLTLEEIDDWYPRLLPGIAGHPGVGWVMVRSSEHGPVVLGPSGRHLLATGHVEGDDPLAPFGPTAADDLRRHDGLGHVGDLLVNSVYDPVTDEVAAFEELTGCHGGLGGWQNQPVLIHPVGWPREIELTSADAVHHQLVRWLSRLGQRTDEKFTLPESGNGATTWPAETDGSAVESRARP
jgi:uncharacterized membrane protein YvlD (DUF360 family)